MRTKARFNLSTPHVPYIGSETFTPICHLDCIVPTNAARSDNGAVGGYILHGEVEEDQAVIDETPCCFCGKL